MKDVAVTEAWQPKETTTHQDHVIAHVVGAKILGYFVWDEALHALLDIGFIWTIFVDGQMALLPHGVAVAELEIDDKHRSTIAADVDRLLAGQELTSDSELKLPESCYDKNCEIESVDFFANEDQRRLVIKGGEVSLGIDTSLTTAEIHVYEY